MYYSDKPINSEKEDRLGRISFSKQLARAIVSLNVEESFCIGLFGEWGCGKTSVINMAIQEINNIAEDMDYEQRPVVVQFNPWNFTDNSQLLSQFFSTICLQLRTDERNRKLLSVGDAIEQYSTALAYTEFIPFIGKYLRLIPTITKSVGTKMRTSAEKDMSDASRRKNIVADALMNQKHKIIVVIDDIDRLSNEQIRQIFQLVNTVACFPNIIYVLSFDKDIVVRALEKVQDCDGNKYLEKIIQVPFQLPELSKERLWTVFFERIDKVMQGKTFLQVNQEYWAKIFWDCIAPFINDLRDINRIINGISLKSGLLGEEVNYADLVAITGIEIMCPEVYRWIINNKTKLVGGKPFDEYTDKQSEDNERMYIEKFRSLSTYYAKDIVGALASLFPKFANEVGYNYELAEEDDFICELRIAQNKLFDLYFSLSVDGVSISRSTLNETIYRMGEEELKKYLKMFGDNSAGMDYLLKLKSNIRKVPYERIEILVRGLIENAVELTNAEGENGVSLSSLQYAEQCIIKLIARLKTDEERCALLSGCITYGSIDSMQSITLILYRICKAYGRYGNTNIDEKDKLVTEEQLNKLETKYVARITEFGYNYNILDILNSKLIIDIWNECDKKSFTKYINIILKNNINKMKFIALYYSCIGKGTEQKFKYDMGYLDYIDNQTATAAIESVMDSPEWDNMDESFKQKMMVFILWNNNLLGEGQYIMKNELENKEALYGKSRLY